METARSLRIALLLIPFALLGCALLTPAGPGPRPTATANVAPTAAPPRPTPLVTPEASVAPAGATSTAIASASPAPATATAIATATRLPTSPPSPTTAALALEVVQSQTWADRQGNIRTNVLVRNPYEFPVTLAARAHATLRNSAGDFMKDAGLYFLDGISGGSGFLLPGETVAANACFTCEQALLTDPWAAVNFTFVIQDGTGVWNYVTDVTASGVTVAFDGDSPIFWITGSVKNNSDTAVSRISLRVVVFDQQGQLVGAAEASASDVAAGASASVRGYGIGQAPAGPIKHEVTVLGVHY